MKHDSSSNTTASTPMQQETIIARGTMARGTMKEEHACSYADVCGIFQVLAGKGACDIRPFANVFQRRNNG